jgi:hypothetical protein
MLINVLMIDFICVIIILVTGHKNAENPKIWKAFDPKHSG